MARELSARRIIGFACNQAFMFFLFYMGASHAAGQGQSTLQRFDLLATLACMVVGFAVMRALPAGRLGAMLSRPLLYVYALIGAAASLMPVFAPEASWPLQVVQGLLTGVPCAFLLTAWGRAFGSVPSETSVPEVFVGSLAGAVLCLVFSALQASDLALLATRILPLASVANIEVSKARLVAQPATIELDSEPARTLSAKILAGTFLFGVAAGLMELSIMSASAAVPHYRVGLVIYGAFLVGGVTLLLSDGFGRGAALNKSYRLAVFVMIVGVLLVPVPQLATSTLPGQAVVLAGYLGLEAVLVCLFVVMAEVTATDCARSFSAGFLALFAGEFVGALASGLLLQDLSAFGVIGEVAGSAAAAAAGSAAATGSAAAAAVGEVAATGSAVATGDAVSGIAASAATIYPLLTVVAGALALLSYVFLFTERDFDMLSQIVSEGDRFEETCRTIAERYALSPREAEILVFALRGRTSERIAQELVISKNTVDTHLRRIYAKCGVHSRQELLDLAEEA